MKRRDRWKSLWKNHSTSSPATEPHQAALSTPQGQTPATIEANGDSTKTTSDSSVIKPVLDQTSLETSSADVGTKANPILQLALETHIDQLSGDEKKVFLEANRDISDRTLFNEIDKLDLAHASHSRFRQYAPALQRTFALLNRFFAGLSVVIQGDPAFASFVIGGLRLVVDLAMGLVSFFDKLVEMMTRLGDYLEPLSHLANAIGSDSSTMHALADIYGDLLTFCRVSRNVFIKLDESRRSHVSMTIFFRSLWDPFEAEFSEIESRLRHHLSVLDVASTALTLTQISSIAIRDDARQHKEMLKEREDFLRWVSSISHEERHRAMFNKREPGTGTWLLESSQFQTFINCPTSILLWCRGKAGVGKSVHTSNVIETVLERYGPQKDVGICFAYYDHSQAVDQKNDIMIASLVKQLCQKTDIPESFLKIKEKGDLPNSLGDFHHFETVARTFKQVIIVFDALDECPELERPSLLRFLRQCMEKLPCVHIFVTSRPETDIVLDLESYGAPTIHISAENVTGDINKYIHSEVSRLRSGYDGRKLFVNDQLAKEIIDTLIQNADGMFLWVNLQLQQLCKASLRRRDSVVREALQKLPSGLDATYHRILEDIEKNDHGLKELAYDCLAWTLYSESPLTLIGLQQAVAHTNGYSSGAMNPAPEDADAIAAACANLLDLHGYMDIRPIHYSVKEFLTSPASSGSSYGSLGTSWEMHRKLAAGCMTGLRSMMREGPCQTPEDLRRRVFERPILWYAARYFDVHLVKSASKSDNDSRMVQEIFQLDELCVASVLQLRALKGYDTAGFAPHPHRDFILPQPMDNACLMVSSQLFHTPWRVQYWPQHKPSKGVIHHATLSGLTDAVSFLIDRGAVVDEKDGDGATPLYHAAQKGYVKILEILISNGADVSTSGARFGSPLQAACFGGHDYIIEILLEHGANVNAQGGYYGNALQAAALYSFEAVQLLIDAGADVNAIGGQFGTALQAAARYDLELVEFFLDQGAKADIQAGYYGSALQAAAYKGHSTICMRLLAAGADVNVSEGADGCALRAAVLGGNLGVLLLLLDYGADVDLESSENGTALELAALLGDYDIVELLLRHGASVRTERSDAIAAAESNGLKLVLDLLYRQVDEVEALS